MSEHIDKHVTSTFRSVSEIILSRLHLQLKSSRVVIKDISITGIIARVPWIQEKMNYAITSVPDLKLFTVALLYSPHYPGFKRGCYLGHSPWSVLVGCFDLPGSNISTFTPCCPWAKFCVSGNTDCAGAPGVSVRSQSGPGCRSILRMPGRKTYSPSSQAVFRRLLVWADWGYYTILNLY